MRKTKHAMQRMSQRGIRSSVVEILKNYGVPEGDRITLNRKNCLALSKTFGDLKRTSEKMAEKGGYELVSKDGALITVYRLGSDHLHRSRGERHG